jgi:hypothetical protein
MTSLSELQNSDCEQSLPERIAGAVVVTVFGSIVALNTASVVLALLVA